jgi:hypothetical protein
LKGDPPVALSDFADISGGSSLRGTAYFFIKLSGFPNFHTNRKPSVHIFNPPGAEGSKINNFSLFTTKVIAIRKNGNRQVRKSGSYFYFSATLNITLWKIGPIKPIAVAPRGSSLFAHFRYAQKADNSRYT